MADISLASRVEDSSHSTKVSHVPQMSTDSDSLSSTVLTMLKDATASGVTHTSIDHPSYPEIVIDAELKTRIIAPPNEDSNEKLYFIHGTSSSQVQAYGEHLAAFCAEQDIMFASFFFRRRGTLDVFPAEYKRLVPTLAYQICVSPRCPKDLRIEILGALYMEPDIPEQTMYNQFKKLLISPLRKCPLDPHSAPIVLILDSIHNCEDVKHLVVPISRVVSDLIQAGGLNIKFVITSLSYRYVLNTFQKQQDTSALTYTHPILSRYESHFQSIYFSALNYRYELPDLVQRFVTVLSMFVLWMCTPYLLAVVLIVLGFPPFLAGVLGWAVVLLPTMVVSMYWLVSFQVRMYRESARLLQSRD
jgi:hypothetical protein